MIPFPLVRAYAAALPRLQARESLDGATRVAVGAGALKPDAARRIRSAWERQASLEQPRRAGSLDEALARAAAAGIRVTKVGRGA